MTDGFSTIKMFSWALGAVVAAALVLPEAGDQFNRLKLTKSPPGRTKLATTTTTEPTATTTTEPTVTESTSNALYPEDSIITSNFDIDSELVPSWGTGAIAPLSGDVGAFRFVCNAGQLLYDDPIVYPGQPGASHLHQFFGNTSANANSTYESLRTQGQSTCNSPLNRSAYWMPAMMNGAGQVVRPDYVSIYYKRWPASDSKCDPKRDSQAVGICIPLPNGLRYVFGVDMLNPSAIPTGYSYFNCDGPGATQGHYPDIVTAALYCPAGSRLGAVIHAPQCWDGKNLDSPDHRSHVAYATAGSWRNQCPATHPYAIPEFTMGAWYTVDESLDRSGTWVAGQTKTWHLSSDMMPGMAPARPGTTFHADWWGAWDNIVQAMWMDNCIDKRLSCAGGDLGNGKQLKMFSGFTWNADPRLVPVP